MRIWKSIETAKWFRFLDRGYIVYFFTSAVMRMNKFTDCVRCGKHRVCIYVEPDIWKIRGPEGENYNGITLYLFVEKFFVAGFLEEGIKAGAFPVCEHCYEKDGISGYSEDYLYPDVELYVFPDIF